MYYNSTAPSGPPRNVMVMGVHPGSLDVSWDPPLEIDQNGPIIGYDIEYTMVGSTSSMSDTTYSGRQFVISGIVAYANYSVRVAAKNFNGTGSFSIPVIEESGHEGEHKHALELKVTAYHIILYYANKHYS